MVENSEEIKKDFENKINNLREHDKKKRLVFVAMLYVASIVLFGAVLFGTVVSYKNYINAKNNQPQQTEVDSKNVIELKKID